MKNILTILLAVTIPLAGCNNKQERPEETILKGTATVIVDETLLPIIKEQIMVFESDYDAKINAIARSEKEAIQAFMADTARIVILPRDLTEQELRMIEQKTVNPMRTKFATDGIVFIANSRHRDSIVALADVLSFIKGGEGNKIGGLVFDNPNSSTVRFLADMAKIESVPDQGIYSFKTNKEAIEFISQNEGMIGVVGLNWILESDDLIKSNKVQILAVKGLGNDRAYKPTQSNIAEGKYPLARDLFIINAQGYAGLGMGFGSFITGERGQRIILKSGLLPVRLPSRNILIRNQIEK